MRRWFLAPVTVLMLLAPSVAHPCGFSPCERAGYNDAAPLHDRIVRPHDWRYQRLPTLLGAYFGDAAATAVRGGSTRARMTRADYDAAVARVFASLGRPAPVLPPVARDQPAWDGVCAGNDFVSAAQFVEAVGADRALAAHAERLVAWRTRLVGLCPSDTTQVDALVADLRSASTDAGVGDAAGYLTAAALFYGGHGAEAATQFAALSRSTHPWIREAASYTRGRALLVAAQSDWDGYSDFDRIDGTLLDRARAAFTAYLASFPRGRYADSATNMARRLAFLEQDGEALNRLSVEHFARLLEARRFDAIAADAASEITNYLDLTAFTIETFPFEHPLLAATLRPHVPALDHDPAAALRRLERVRARYAAYPGLYELIAVPLLAAAGTPSALTMAAPADAPAAVRMAVLYERAAALEGAKRYREARAVLRGIAIELPALIEDDRFVADVFRLHLADGDFSEAYVAGSPFTHVEVAADLFERIAPETTLLALATGPSAPAAYREVLFRRLRERRWRDFLVLYEQVGKPEPFTKVETAARALDRNPRDPRGLFNVGYFLYQRNGVSGDCCACELLDAPPRAVVESGAAPIALYSEAITLLATSPNPVLEPKLLHYAILCFKEDSDAAACQRGASATIEASTRAAWFTRLKATYPSSPWTVRTRYYY